MSARKLVAVVRQDSVIGVRMGLLAKIIVQGVFVALEYG